MLVLKGGISAISAGLDHWFKRENGDEENLDPDEYKVEEWRLQRLLGVHHFCLPPDFRQRRRGVDTPNTQLTVPVLRFPQWHFCPRCGSLSELPLSTLERVRCTECKESHRAPLLSQVRFIAMCEDGHVQDFPWREWVHFSRCPACNGGLSLSSTGSASLAAQKIRCSCGAERSLARIVEADPDGTTYLSKHLERGEADFLCPGARPWLGKEKGQGCERHLRGSLRGAANVWFAQIRSAIYLPSTEATAPSELLSLLREPPLSTLLELVRSSEVKIGPAELRRLYRELLEPYSDEALRSALGVIDEAGDVQPETPSNSLEPDEQHLRTSEYEVLRHPTNEPSLISERVPISSYRAGLERYLSRVVLVRKLRETRVLTGFSRVYAETTLTPREQRAMLFWHIPEYTASWLPAYVVHGEGIYIELRTERVAAWQAEEREILRDRLQPLVENYDEMRQQRHLRARNLSPSFVLVHTFAHLLINRLVFECGYASASLRERLYISDDSHEPVAAVLIYTAAGDSEGTLGGLVRMGRPGFLEPVIQRALEAAQWCSSDPVCMEVGSSGGQGPDSCNLAACHNCALIPETACEEFNRFLDRGLVVGEPDRSELGFFGEFLPG